ncbi:hypothetical protein PV646_17750 [Streptomyces sp. ID05-26A]|nr:hypothetical protein [Streptomyces sp. ID05-26A]
MEKASGDPATWLVLCWFDSAESAAEWDGSRSHATWREYVGRFSSRVEPPQPAPPAAAPPRLPPKWKTAVVTLIGVFPAVLLVNVTVIPRVTGLPLLARTLVLCVCVTGLMTWVLMPQVMKVLGPWLRRGAVPAPPADQPVRTSLPDVEVLVTTSPGLRPPAVPPDNEARQGSRPPRASRSRHAAPATFPSARQSRSRRP